MTHPNKQAGIWLNVVTHSSMIHLGEMWDSVYLYIIFFLTRKDTQVRILVSYSGKILDGLKTAPNYLCLANGIKTGLLFSKAHIIQFSLKLWARQVMIKSE